MQEQNIKTGEIVALDDLEGRSVRRSALGRRRGVADIFEEMSRQIEADMEHIEADMESTSEHDGSETDVYPWLSPLPELRRP